MFSNIRGWTNLLKCNIRERKNYMKEIVFRLKTISYYVFLKIIPRKVIQWLQHKPWESKNTKILKRLDQMEYRFLRAFESYNDSVEMPKAKWPLRDYQMVQLKLFKEISDFLVENKIEYWLDFGTLLGSVRHGGFIPWDDDIDISMLRSELCRLIDIASAEDCPLCVSVVQEYEWRVYKITMVEDGVKCPIAIDIFPYDFCNVEDEEQIGSFWSDYLNNKNSLKAFCKLHEPYNSSDKENKESKYFQQTTDYINQMLSKYETDKKDFVILGVENVYFYNRPIIVRYSDVFPLKTKKFENLNLPVPNNYYAILSIFYGDFWKMPTNMNSTHNISNQDMVVQIKEANSWFNSNDF